MKKLALLAVAAFALLGVEGVQASSVSTNGLITTFSITAMVQSPTLVRSNSNGTVITEKYKITKTRFITKDLLAMLATEFNTTFPSGAQLAYQINGGRFVVLDNKGNLLMNVSSNLVDTNYDFSLISGTNAVGLESGSVVLNQSTNNPSQTGQLTETENDTTIHYADGNGNDFRLVGLIVYKFNAVSNSTLNEYKSYSWVLDGGGGGLLNHNTPTIMTGKVSAKGSRIPQ